MSCMYFPRQLRPPDDSTESSDSITYWRKLLVPRQAVTASGKLDVLHLYAIAVNVIQAIW
jgi:hypothetical protein